MEFRPYMHIERFGNDEVQGIELGGCYVFPKLDGTNGSVWWADGIRAGSRNREVTTENDNAGFCQWVLNGKHGLYEFLIENHEFRLYGEWLVPHTFKHYRDEAWKKFYVFDVYDDVEDRYLPYETYSELLKPFDIDFIPPLCSMKNATYDALLVELENNNFLVADGKGCGEGIVIKNYNFQNRFGRTTWAKIVTNAFKDKHPIAMGVTAKNMKQMAEQAICDKYVTKHLVDKVYAKIVNECDGWNSKYIPRLLNTVFYDLVNEETWNYIKEMKMPTVNFKTLNSLCIITIKQLKPELF